MQKYTRYDTIYCYIHVTYCNVIEFSLQLMNLSQQVRPGQTYTNQTSPLSLLTTYTLYTTNMYTHLCDEGTAWSTISCGLDSPLIFTSASCDLSEFRLQSSRHLPLLWWKNIPDYDSTYIHFAYQKVTLYSVALVWPMWLWISLSFTHSHMHHFLAYQRIWPSGTSS